MIVLVDNVMGGAEIVRANVLSTDSTRLMVMS